MKRRAVPLFATLALLLSWAHALAQQKPHDFARYEKEILAFEQADLTSPPPKGALLFIGSSAIRRWTSLAQDFPKFQVINRGFGGSEIEDSTHFASRIVFPYAPRAIYFRAGGNDLARGKSVERVFSDYREFVSTVRAKLPETDIIFISLCPSIQRWKQADQEKALNSLIANFVKGKPHLGYIESYDIPLSHNGQPRPELFVEDGLHFNAEGYKLLAARVGPELGK